MFDKKRRQEELRDWLTNDEDYRRYEYSVSRKPIFFDLGAFKGQWSRRMVRKYGGVSHMFEIQPPLIGRLKRRFRPPHFFVHPFGLADKNLRTEAMLSHRPDACSVFGCGCGSRIKVRLLRMADWVRSDIDVCKINIEGAEYDLLEHMLEEDVVGLCENIQVQYHWQYDVPDFDNRRRKIREALSQTHELTYDYYYVWENWRKR